MNVVILINSTVSAPMAAGVTAGQFRYTLTPVTGDPISHDSMDNSATFTDVPPGQYVASAVRLGSDGNAIAPAVTADVTVPDTVPVPTPDPVQTVVNADVPAAITVSLA